MTQVKSYKILEGDKFPKPFNKKGAKIKLIEKRAADYVKKGILEPLDNEPEAKKADTKKATKKAIDTDNKPKTD